MRLRYLFVWLVICAFLLSWAGPVDAQRKALSSLEEEITSLVESIKPSLVTIEAEARALRAAKKRGVPSAFVGSGIIYTSDGYILTTASVVGKMKTFKVTLPSQKSLKGKLVGVDEESNLAVLKVETGALTPAKLGDSDKVKVGSWLTVVGNSYGLPNAVALGLVNGLREDGFIQMSANVSPGNSGGPVLDTYGKVIGIVSAKLSEPSYISAMTFYTDEKGKATFTIPSREIEIPSSGVSLALPANRVKAMAEQIIKHGTVKRGYLGIYPENLDETLYEKYNRRTGVLVTEVVKGSPAQKAGLSDGDLIIEFGGTAVVDGSHIRELIKTEGAGTQVELKVLRNGKLNDVIAVLGEAKPVFSYTWEPNAVAPEPPELQVVESYYERAYNDYLQQVEGWTDRDERMLDQLQEEIKMLKLDMKKLSQELERLKLEKSKE
ncbi:MAG: trypsin-like peptidase domain-containing protein [Candidatus Zixiibacteriota bacterium]|nr:MAG: trypsin-like peptidase domain-containing protein [candidate division Zixibacteria bacterium]